MNPYQPNPHNQYSLEQWKQFQMQQQQAMQQGQQAMQQGYKKKKNCNCGKKKNQGNQ